MKNVVQKIFLSDFSIRCKPWKTLARSILLTMGVMIDIGCPSPESPKHYFRESNFKVTFDIRLRFIWVFNTGQESVSAFSTRMDTIHLSFFQNHFKNASTVLNRFMPFARKGKKLFGNEWSIEAVKTIPELEFDQTANLTAEAGGYRWTSPVGADAEPVPELAFDQTLGR